MNRSWMVSSLLVAAALSAQSQSKSRQAAVPAADAPQRTIFTTPTGVRPDSDSAPKPAASDSSAVALEKYREMWRKMTPAQQKAFLDSGGYTPEQYERMLKPKEAGPGGGADPQRKIDPMMDSLNKSLQNLDTIRDANLGRVQREICPPEVAARIADLKAKLQNHALEGNGVPAPAAASIRPRASAAPIDPLTIAANWYKPATGAGVADHAAQQSRLLGEVLPSAEAAAPRPQADDQEIARAKSELEQLSGACTAPVR